MMFTKSGGTGNGELQKQGEGLCGVAVAEAIRLSHDFALSSIHF
jgi:hypothetical protein